jgi:aspartyl-tRNA synthetase
MYECNEDREDRLQPQPVLDAAGRLAALESQDPLTIKAYQYDIVCNGVELSSGAIRNHRPRSCTRRVALGTATRKEDVEERLRRALETRSKFGAPRHARTAPGNSIASLTASARRANIREVIAFAAEPEGAGPCSCSAAAPVARGGGSASCT